MLQTAPLPCCFTGAEAADIHTNRQEHMCTLPLQVRESGQEGQRETAVSGVWSKQPFLMRFLL
jgi:hypothetical protein